MPNGHIQIIDILICVFYTRSRVRPVPFIHSKILYIPMNVSVDDDDEHTEKDAHLNTHDDDNFESIQLNEHSRHIAIHEREWKRSNKQFAYTRTNSKFICRMFFYNFNLQVKLAAHIGVLNSIHTNTINFANRYFGHTQCSFICKRDYIFVNVSTRVRESEWVSEWVSQESILSR